MQEPDKELGMGRTAGKGGVVVAVLVLVSAGGAEALAAQERGVEVELAHGSEREARAADQLRTLLTDMELDPWILTRRVRIQSGVIPHSHPVLTLNTRSLDEPDEMLATFLHEQLHWVEDLHPGPWSEAMAAYRRLYPEVPSSAEGGARDEESTYRHLLVCHMELQAVSALLGEARARELLGGNTHYEWIYQRVLEDPRVGEVALRHGFDSSRGAPQP